MSRLCFAAVEMRGPLLVLASASSSNPSQEEASQIRRRISGEFSPMPAVNTSPSTAAQHCSQGTDLLGRAINEVIHRQTGFGFTPGEQVAHVVTDTGNPEQTRFLVENGLNLFSRQPEALKQIQERRRDQARPAWFPYRVRPAR